MRNFRCVNAVSWIRKPKQFFDLLGCHTVFCELQMVVFSMNGHFAPVLRRFRAFCGKSRFISFVPEQKPIYPTLLLMRIASLLFVAITAGIPFLTSCGPSLNVLSDNEIKSGRSFSSSVEKITVSSPSSALLSAAASKPKDKHSMPIYTYGERNRVVRTTAYTCSEDDHIEYGSKNATGTNLRYSDKVRSAAADWSFYPVGTVFRIKGMSQLFRCGRLWLRPDWHRHDRYLQALQEPYEPMGQTQCGDFCCPMGFIHPQCGDPQGSHQIFPLRSDAGQYQSPAPRSRESCFQLISSLLTKHRTGIYCTGAANRAARHAARNKNVFFVNSSSFT